MQVTITLQQLRHVKNIYDFIFIFARAITAKLGRIVDQYIIYFLGDKNFTTSTILDKIFGIK